MKNSAYSPDRGLNKGNLIQHVPGNKSGTTWLQSWNVGRMVWKLSVLNCRAELGDEVDT